MGIRGLTTYISENEEMYFKPFELCDTYLVIDGNSICSQLYVSLLEKKNSSIFGGDYDEFYNVVQSFFLSLAKCNVIPIVLIDGSYERKKIKTVLQRFRAVVRSLKSFNYGDLQIKLFPIFLFRTFVDAITDLNIKCVQCYFEADAEIASTAKALKCPVLSLDSDFYIFSVDYIPFNTLRKEPVKIKSNDKEFKYYIQCSIFHVDNFLKAKGLNKSLLPIFVTLLGNDYIDGSMFQLLFNHMIIPKNRRSYAQRKIHGIIQWLKKENFDSAIKGILLHVKNENSPKVLNAIYSTAKHYAMGFVSCHVYELIETLLNDAENTSWLEIREANLTWPKEIDVLYKNAQLSSFMVNLIILGMCFTHVQVEDLSMKSTCFQSLRLIGGINEILCKYQAGKSHAYKLYSIINKSYSGIHQNWCDELKNINVNNILELSCDERMKIFFDVLDLSEDDIGFVSVFSGSWTLFIATCVYWINYDHEEFVTFRHVAALMLMAISNEIVQKSVGYHKTNAAFINKFGPILKASSESNFESEEASANDFESLKNRVTKCECVVAQSSLMPLRAMISPKLHASTIHVFNSFQSCLFHTLQLNVLLNFPIPYLKISEFYSGTFLFNIYENMKKNSDFDQKILSRSPNLLRIYNYLCNAFSKYLTQINDNEKRERKRRKRRKKVNARNRLNKNEEVIVCASENDPSSGDEYEDVDNPYRLLSKLQALNFSV